MAEYFDGIMAVFLLLCLGITMFNISVDQFIHGDSEYKESSCRKHIDILLDSMNKQELAIIEYAAEGIQKFREERNPD